MLSHSTKGSAKHALVDKVTAAVSIAHEKYPELNLDGELQLDAAIDCRLLQNPKQKTARLPDRPTC